jgi:hypothetical protein
MVLIGIDEMTFALVASLWGRFGSHPRLANAYKQDQKIKNAS